MLNLIRMELRRMVVSKSFRVMIAVTIALILFALSLIYLIAPIAPDNVTVDRPVQEITAVNFALSLISSPTLAIFAIFFTLFVMAEQKGFIKNIAGQLPHRGMLILSKLPSAVVMAWTIFLTVLVTATLPFVIVGHFDMLGDFSRLPGAIAQLTLLYLGFAAFVLFLGAWLRNQGGVMTIAILQPAGTFALLYNGINFVMLKLFGSLPFDVNHFTLEQAMNSAISLEPLLDLSRVLTIGAAYLVIFTSIAVAIYQKRDIR